MIPTETLKSSASETNFTLNDVSICHTHILCMFFDERFIDGGYAIIGASTYLIPLLVIIYHDML